MFSPRTVWVVKYSFSKLALSVSSEITSSLFKGGMVLCWSGLMKCLRVFHQSLVPVYERSKFSVKLKLSLVVLTCVFLSLLCS